MKAYTEDRLAWAELQSVIDSLNANVAVLDGDGTIMLVSSAWIRFADQNGDVGAAHSLPGMNYFDACSLDDVVDGNFARRAYEGIRAVLRRELPAFSMEYPCHSPWQERWFVMLVAPVGVTGAMVTHVDVSAEDQLGA